MPEQYDPIIARLRHYCAFQERCINDVEQKLKLWKVNQKHIEKIIDQLIKEDYLNEERFARSYAGGKFRINHWGKTRIIHELERRKVPDLIIQIGFDPMFRKNLIQFLCHLPHTQSIVVANSIQ